MTNDNVLLVYLFSALALLALVTKLYPNLKCSTI